MANLQKGIGSEGLTQLKSWINEKLASKANATHTHAISDVTNLQQTLDGKAPISHTHVCADISDLNNTLNSYAKKSDITNLYDYKGSCTWAELIAKTDAEKSDVYNVTDKGGMNYACINPGTAGEASWDPLGSITTVDLSGYYTISQIDEKFLTKTDAASTYAPTSHTHEMSQVNGLEAALAEKASATDLSALQTTVSGHTSQISGIKTTLANKADKSELPQEMTTEEVLAILNG